MLVGHVAYLRLHGFLEIYAALILFWSLVDHLRLVRKFEIAKHIVFRFDSLIQVLLKLFLVFSYEILGRTLSFDYGAQVILRNAQNRLGFTKTHQAFFKVIFPQIR